MVETEAEPAVGPVEIETTPEERAENLRQMGRFRANLEFLNSLGGELRTKHMGKFICAAGEELFVGDDAKAVMAEARAKHPEDIGGMFSMRVLPHVGRPSAY